VIFPKNWKQFKLFKFKFFPLLGALSKRIRQTQKITPLPLKKNTGKRQEKKREKPVDHKVYQIKSV
jgi:hypothetical protein